MLRSLQATSTPSIWGFRSFLLLPSSAARLKAAGVFFVTAWWQCYTFSKTSISILFQDRIACQQLMFTSLWFLFYRLCNPRADISEINRLFLLTLLARQAYQYFAKIGLRVSSWCLYYCEFCSTDYSTQEPISLKINRLFLLIWF
jgi:hypothetical protein